MSTTSLFGRGRQLASCAVFAVLFAVGSGASAAPCTATNPLTNPDASLTNSTSCGLGTLDNDDAAGVNLVEPSAALWTAIDKNEGGNGGSTGALLSTGVPDSTSGNWGIDTQGLTHTSYLIVIKDGQAGGGSTWAWFVVDTTFACVGNLFAGAEHCGTWTMYDSKGISHLSLYGTTTASTGTPSGSTGTPSGSTGVVPEPGSSSLALLGLGLLGVGFGLRKKSLRG